MKKKVFALLLVLVLALSVTLVACKKKDKTDKYAAFEHGGAVCNDYKVGGQVIIGNSTALSGDFIFTGLGKSSVGATDQDVNVLTTGYSTMEVNRGGSYVWNKTAVEKYEEKETENGTYLITIDIKPGLKMSGGTEVKAVNYLAYILAVASPAGKAFAKNTTGQAFVGYNSYIIYDGTNAGQEVMVDVLGEDGKPTGQKRSAGIASKTFKGIRLLGEYKFSLEISTDYYPFYFADTYGAVSPYDLELVLGKGAEVKDDGEGAYLTGNWYDKGADGTYVKKAHLETKRYDYFNHEYTGPYTISKWSEADKQVTLKLNPNYAGNFEGQKPHIETVIIRQVVEETQIGQLKQGEVDVLEGLTGSDSVNAALGLIREGGFKEVHYDRAGYGKVQFDCDFGPTMFTEVRQAVAYCLDRTDFANTFCGGFGSVANGPYSNNFDAATANEEALNALNSYAVSTTKAKEALKNGGWVYNADGTAYDEAKGGIRYKKLSAGEYGVNDANKTYESVSNTDGKVYKTTLVNGEYYLPCAINWFASVGDNGDPNPVSELLTSKLQSGSNLTQAGIVLRKTEGSFTKLLGEIYREAEYGYAGKPTYGMFNLATGWNSAVYDYSFNWIDSSSDLYDDYFGYSTNKLSDPYDKDFKWDDAANKGLTYAQAVEKSGGKLGMNYISMAMVYSVKPGETEEYNKWFLAYMQRWNELLPDIPLYSNVYYDAYNSEIVNFKTTPFFGAAEALLYAAIGSVQTAK